MHRRDLFDLVKDAESVLSRIRNVDVSYFGRNGTHGSNMGDIQDRLMEAKALATCCVERLQRALQDVEAIGPEDTFILHEPEGPTKPGCRKKF
jgi:hypothetical protein